MTRYRYTEGTTVWYVGWDTGLCTYFAQKETDDPDNDLDNVAGNVIGELFTVHELQQALHGTTVIPDDILYCLADDTSPYPEPEAAALRDHLTGGYDDTHTTTTTPNPTTAPHPTGRKNIMSTRTITGNLAADPEVVPAGTITITKLRVIENTGEYRKGEWQEHDHATTHFVQARFELGDNAAATLHKGDAVIVVGREHTESWGSEDARQYGRVIDADHIGADLSRAVATIRRLVKTDASA
jgi:single-strand DNA-binding protein